MNVRAIIAVAAAAALGALGVAAWLAWRRGRTIDAGALGRLSPPTLAVAALSSLGVAYHAAAHGLGLGTLKAPMWIAALVGLTATALAVLLDAVERRSDARHDGEDRT